MKTINEFKKRWGDILFNIGIANRSKGTLNALDQLTPDVESLMQSAHDEGVKSVSDKPIDFANFTDKEKKFIVNLKLDNLSRETLLMMIMDEFAAKIPKEECLWIDFDKQKPKEFGRYLVKGASNYPITASYNVNLEEFNNELGYSLTGVTHWLMLPKPEKDHDNIQ